jgi:hypothetical protein
MFQFFPLSMAFNMAIAFDLPKHLLSLRAMILHHPNKLYVMPVKKFGQLTNTVKLAMSTANSMNENVLLQSEVVTGPYCIF